MQRNICLAQNLKELKYILKNSSNNVSVIPLNLEVYLYVIVNKIDFINPSNYLDTKFHKDSLINGQKNLKKIVFTKKIDSNVKDAVIVFLRFRYYSYCFLEKILKNILKKKTNKIIISGWQNRNHIKLDEYIVSDIVNQIVPKSYIITISKEKKQKLIESLNYEYGIQNFPEDKKNKLKILLNNAGYNFRRLIILNTLSKINFYVPIFAKLSFISKIKFFIFKVHPIYIKKKYKKKNIKFNSLLKVNNKSKIIKYFANKANLFFEDVFKKNESIKDILKKLKFNLVLSNISIAPYSSITCKEKTKSICIPHGTIVESFNKYDKIYKNNISQSVFRGDSKYFALQSMLTKRACKTQNIKGKFLQTGNLLFAFNKKKSGYKKDIILASTQKDFTNMQMLGVEMFYEVYENFIFFNEIAKKSKFNYVVKLHPSMFKNIPTLQSLFPNLIFKKEKIELLLKNSLVLVSFSSTVIEDALYSSVPVILFDPHSRYQHCDAEKKINIKNKAIYYLDKKKFFLKLLNTIEDSNNFNFKKYIFESDPYNNFKKLLKKTL